MFEHFNSSESQIEKYHKSAMRDLKIAADSNIPEVSFRFCYDALLKLAIAICAKNGLRVKARRGHHIELIKKLSFYLNDAEIEILANEMRSKRNWDLYGGGALISSNDAEDYVKWVKEVFQSAEKYFSQKQLKLNLRVNKA